MRVRIGVRLLILVILVHASYAWAAPRYDVLTLGSGIEAMRYVPKKFNWFQARPLLVALHGMSETMAQSCEVWQPVAEELGMILLCPKGSNFEKGYTRRPMDDRQVISGFVDMVEESHRVNREKSVLVGFSRGGNFAIELGVRYPDKFQNVVCIFGFFNRGVERIVQRQAFGGKLGHSKFNFITGRHDVTEASSRFGFGVFRKYGISSKLKVHFGFEDMIFAWELP